MACYGLSAAAQVQESKNFIYLFSDSIIYAEKVRMRYDAFNYPVVRADARKFSTDQVKFFNNSNGFFANTRKLDILGRSGFAERVEEGKLNLFREVNYDPYDYDEEYDWRYRRGYAYYRGTSMSSDMYFNKGYGNLKRLNYKNLKESMTDAPECMDMLAAYRKKTTTRNILFGAAGASFIAGAIAGFIAVDHSRIGSKDSGFNTAIALVGSSFGFAFGGVMVHLSASRQLRSTVDTYNRH